MHEIIDKKFYLGPKFGTLINKKWITISELLQKAQMGAIRARFERRERILVYKNVCMR
jgi:hypothetical protein